MLRRTFVFRLTWLFVAALQLSLLAAAEVAEARWRAAGVAELGTTHIESESTRHGSPVHSTHCVVCQYLSTTGVAATPERPPVPLVVVALPQSGQREEIPASPASLLPLPRAPPTIS